METKKLSFQEMEMVEGGDGMPSTLGCIIGIGGTVVAIAGVAKLTVITGGTAAIFAFSYLTSALTAGWECGNALAGN